MQNQISIITDGLMVTILTVYLFIVLMEKNPLCLLNIPSTFHDSTIADYGVYDEMEKVYNANGAKVVVDSAFNIGTKYYVIKSVQKDPLDTDALLLNRAATSIKKLSEQGMHMIEGSFL